MARAGVLRMGLGRRAVVRILRSLLPAVSGLSIGRVLVDGFLLAASLQAAYTAQAESNEGMLRPDAGNGWLLAGLVASAPPAGSEGVKMSTEVKAALAEEVKVPWRRSKQMPARPKDLPRRRRRIRTKRLRHWTRNSKLSSCPPTFLW